MNKKSLFIAILTTIVSGYTKTESKFDPRVCDRIEVHTTVYKHENCDSNDWKEICEQMTNLLEQVKETEGIKGQISMYAFDTNKIDEKNRHEDKDTAEDKNTFEPEKFDMVSMNTTVTKGKCSLQDWEKLCKNITALQEEIEKTEGIKSGMCITACHSGQEEENLS